MAAEDLLLYVRKATLPPFKALEDCHFALTTSGQAQADRGTIRLRFVECQDYVVLAGPTGVGKTQFTLALGYRAAHAG